MSQDQTPHPWWIANRLAWVLVALALSSLLITTILGYWQKWPWVELIWRWLELLIIPVVLAAGAFWFNNQTRKSEQDLARRERENNLDISEDRAKEDALQSYFDRMSGLLLKENLRDSDEGAVVRVVASARTQAVIRSLEGDQRGRKSQVVRFLSASDLIGKIALNDVNLSGTDLRGTNLESANLEGANLSGADLRSANLGIADLRTADLSGADLRNANLRGTDLRDASLPGADLRHTHLFSASLPGADLKDADLRYARLNGADLSGADLSGANLSPADLSEVNPGGRGPLWQAEGWTNEQLAQAESLVGATMPDGTKLTTEAWEEFKKRYLPE